MGKLRRVAWFCADLCGEQLRACFHNACIAGFCCPYYCNSSDTSKSKHISVSRLPWHVFFNFIDFLTFLVSQGCLLSILGQLDTFLEGLEPTLSLERSNVRLHNAISRSHDPISRSDWGQGEVTMASIWIQRRFLAACWFHLWVILTSFWWLWGRTWVFENACFIILKLYFLRSWRVVATIKVCLGQKWVKSSHGCSCKQPPAEILGISRHPKVKALNSWFRS